MNTEHAKDFGNVPQGSEDFGSLPNSSEVFGNVPNLSERNENHILTAREVTRMFEEAGVVRTERSIINWCHPDKHGVSRLDCFYDANERKYFVTPQSVERAIKEEQAKTTTGTLPNASETRQSVANDPVSDTHAREQVARETAEDAKRERELAQEILDLKIMNKGKDYFIEQLKADRERFTQEREQFVQQLVTQSQTIGELKTQLVQLEAPKRKESSRDGVRDAEFIEPHETPEDLRRAPSVSEPKDLGHEDSEKPAGGYVQSASDIRVGGGDDSGDEPDDLHKPFNSTGV